MADACALRSARVRLCSRFAKTYLPVIMYHQSPATAASSRITKAEEYNSGAKVVLTLVDGKQLVADMSRVRGVRRPLPHSRAAHLGALRVHARTHTRAAVLT
ncbi:hypothetical protein EON66_08720 [archaeon]|nr:MAG: hypothetical protein EON66_08720 [archaeon]